jgi:hypothetical protein
MDLYRFVPGIVLSLYIGFPRLNQLRFIARDPILTGILENRASSAESVGCFWFRESAQVVIEGDFHGFAGAEAVRTSGDHSNLIVEALDHSARNLPFGPKPVQDQWLMRTQHAGHLFHRLQTPMLADRQETMGVSLSS